MTYHVLHIGPSFRNDKITVWDYMAKICHTYECWVYIKRVHQANDGRSAYELLFDHYLGPNNVGNMATAVKVN
jgi:hypothetical protein